MSLRPFMPIVLVAMVGCGARDQDPMASSDEKSKLLVGHVEGDEDLPPGVIQHTARGADEPARVNRQPEVLDDATLIAATRQASDAEAERLCRHALAAVRNGDWIFQEHYRALNSRRETSVRELQAILRDAKTKPAGRARAAQTLVKLKDASGEQFLFDSLRSASPETCAESLKLLRQWELRDIDFGEAARAEQILTLCGDANAEVAKAAIELATGRNLPGAEMKLCELLESGRAADPEHLALELAKIATTRRSVDAMLPHLFRSKAKDYRQLYGFAFRRVLSNPDQNISVPIRQALHTYLLQFKSQRYDQTLVRDLAATADAASIPVLQDIAGNAPDKVSRMYAVQALARLQPEQAVSLWLQHIQEMGVREDLVRYLAEHVTECDFERVVPTLLAAYERKGQPLDVAGVQLLLEKVGERGRSVVRERLSTLPENARMWAMWKLDGIDLRSALADFHTAGVISLPPDELIAKMNAAGEDQEERTPVDLNDPHGLLGALGWAEHLVMFDVETGTIPCDHHRLVERFADVTNGRLEVQWPIQLWHQQGEEDFNGPYTLQFVSGGRLFRIGAENYGDWYDVEAVVRLLNFALEKTTRPERFIALEPDGQIASYVFADPSAFVPLATTYGLPLAKDHAQAMRQGIEFEQRVIEGFKPK